MTRVSELREMITDAETRRDWCARNARGLASWCQTLRNANPQNPLLFSLSAQIDYLDERHDRLSDQIGRLKSTLREIEAQHAGHCAVCGLSLSEY